MTNARTLTALADEIIANLDETYDLVYVDYRDEATDEQVAAIVRGDMETFYDLTQDWESDSRYESCKVLARQAAEDVLAAWEGDGAEYDLLDEFDGSDEFDRVREEIEQRDTGDWVTNLLRNTPNVLLRINVIDEDHGYSFEEVTPERVLTDVNMPVTDTNVITVRDMLAECSPEYSVLMGYWIVGADVGDLALLPDDLDEVEIVNPYLYLGNPFTGSGFIGEALDGVARVKRSDLRTDEDAFGYSVGEIYGGLNASQFECNIRTKESS